MSKLIQVNVESLPADAEVEVPGLGVFPNGKSSEVTEEQLTTYASLGKTIPDGDFVFEVTQREVPHSEPSDSRRVYDEATRKSDEALQAAAQFQEDRRNDPNATANIGAPVVPVENTDAADDEEAK